jgi:Bardet-Biedl syndrome 5 protein
MEEAQADYMQVKTLRLRDSKFGKALVLETYSRGGGYILGFRMDPLTRLEEVFRELTKLYALFSTNPNFGVDFVLEAETDSLQQLMQPRIEEDAEIIEDQQDTHAVAAYYAEAADDDGQAEREGGAGAGAGVEGAGGVGFDPRLGLAVEAMAEGITTMQLWSVMV